MSWDDFEFGYHWERHLDNEQNKSVWRGRDTVWVGLQNNYKVRDMEELHIHNCLKLNGLLPEWKELFEEELKIRAKEAFNDLL